MIENNLQEPEFGFPERFILLCMLSACQELNKFSLQQLLSKGMTSARPCKTDSKSFPWTAKYNGLFNQGATCYLNSLLQVLFMTEDFKLAVERFVKCTFVPRTISYLWFYFFYPSVLTLFRYSSENPGSEYIDLQLNDLFTDLKANAAQTYNITRKLSIDRGANKHTQTLSHSVHQDTYLKEQGQRRLLELSWWLSVSPGKRSAIQQMDVISWITAVVNM